MAFNAAAHRPARPSGWARPTDLQVCGGSRDGGAGAGLGTWDEASAAARTRGTQAQRRPILGVSGHRHSHPAPPTLCQELDTRRPLGSQNTSPAGGQCHLLGPRTRDTAGGWRSLQWGRSRWAPGGAACEAPSTDAVGTVQAGQRGPAMGRGRGGGASRRHNAEHPVTRRPCGFGTKS